MNSQLEYWRSYLLSRHNVSGAIGLVMYGLAILFMLTGAALIKYRGIVYRSEDPDTFWDCVISLFGIGSIFLLLFFFTFK